MTSDQFLCGFAELAVFDKMCPKSVWIYCIHLFSLICKNVMEDMTHSEQNIVYRDTSHQFVGGILHMFYLLPQNIQMYHGKIIVTEYI